MSDLIELAKFYVILVIAFVGLFIGVNRVVVQLSTQIWAQAAQAEQTHLAQVSLLHTSKFHKI